MITFIIGTLVAGFFGGLAVVVLCWTLSDIAFESERGGKDYKGLVLTAIGAAFTVLLMIGLVVGGMNIYRDEIECDILGGTLSESSNMCVKELPLN